jgi:hypothetical protein
MLVSPYLTTVSPVVTMMAVMGLAAAFATEFGRMGSTRNVVFTFSAFFGFLQHVLIAEFATSRATLFMVLFLGLVLVFTVLDGLVVNLFLVMLLMAMTSHFLFLYLNYAGVTPNIPVAVAMLAGEI